MYKGVKYEICVQGKRWHTQARVQCVVHGHSRRLRHAMHAQGSHAHKVREGNAVQVCQGQGLQCRTGSLGREAHAWQV